MTQPSARELAALVEDTEGAAFSDMIRAAPAALELYAERTGCGTILQAPKFDVLILNRAFGIGIEPPSSEREIRRTVRRFLDAGTRNFGIQLSPESQPAPVVDWVRSCGLQLRDAWAKVYRAAGPAVAADTDLRIDVATEPQAEFFGGLACQGFGMPAVLSPLMSAAVGRPGWRHYIAWSGDETAAVAALFMHGDVGWLGVAATLPPYRRRGAQSALMARRLRDGVASGCRWFVTETSQDRPEKPNSSYRNMKRAGFVDAYHRPNYMLPTV